MEAIRAFPADSRAWVAGVRTGAAALACVAAAFIGAACSGRRMLEGETPFPAKGAVMVDEAGNRLADLPPSAEPLRIIVLDFPWCPPCSDAWEALDKASKSAQGSRIRVFRILFDREKFDTAGGSAEASPLHPAPARPSLAFPVTTLTAMPAAFRERYKVEQVAVTHAAGRIAATGIFPYPPGIPLFAPGERTGDQKDPPLQYLQSLQEVNTQQEVGKLGYPKTGTKLRTRGRLVQVPVRNDKRFFL